MHSLSCCNFPLPGAQEQLLTLLWISCAQRSCADFLLPRCCLAAPVGDLVVPAACMMERILGFGAASLSPALPVPWIWKGCRALRRRAAHWGQSPSVTFLQHRPAATASCIAQSWVPSQAVWSRGPSFSEGWEEAVAESSARARRAPAQGGFEHLLVPILSAHSALCPLTTTTTRTAPEQPSHRSWPGPWQQAGADGVAGRGPGIPLPHGSH